MTGFLKIVSGILFSEIKVYIPSVSILVPNDLLSCNSMFLIAERVALLTSE